MKIETFLWTGATILSIGAFLVSAPPVAYAAEMHGDTRYLREDKGGTDNSKNNDGIDHRDGGNDSIGVRPDRGSNDKGIIEPERHESKTVIKPPSGDSDSIGVSTDRGNHNKDIIEAERHEPATGIKPPSGNNDSIGARPDRDNHDRGTIEAKRHEPTTEVRRRDHGDTTEDRNELYEHRDYGRGNVLVFTWGTSNYRYDRLGTVWYETEGVYHGVWTRRGNSNVFDAVWTYGSRRITAVLTIYLDGDRVTIYRHNGSDGYEYSYTGILSADETDVQGRVSGGPGVRAAWNATITGYRR
jgi:hypothetical protein